MPRTPDSKLHTPDFILPTPRHPCPTPAHPTNTNGSTGSRNGAAATSPTVDDRLDRLQASLDAGNNVTATATGATSGDGRPGDLAERSLADALRVSFLLLKVIMIILTAYYLLLGGYQRVQSGQQVMRLWFGKIVEDATGEGKVYGPGLVYGFPYPIEERITVDTTPQIIDLNDAFWFELNDQTRGRPLDEIVNRGGPLNPERDGSLITGDANVVHGQFQLSFRIADPIQYVQYVGDEALAREIVLNTMQRSLVHAVATTDVDEYIAGRPNIERARQLAQASLDELNTGIVIENFNSVKTIAPLSVRTAYQEVSNAENDKATAINEARQEYNRTLSETAGEAATDLYNLVKDYEAARDVNDTARAGELQAMLNSALETGVMPAQYGGRPLGGSVAQLLNEAKSYRTEIVERVKAEANQFQALLAEYRRNPRILTNRRWQDAREEVFNGDIERIYAPLGNLWIEAGSDPEVMRERERERLEEDRQRREESGSNQR